jgi:hypothetical protein
VTTRSGKAIGQGIGDNLEVEREVVEDVEEEVEEGSEEEVEDENNEENVNKKGEVEKNEKNKKIEKEKKEVLVEKEDEEKDVENEKNKKKEVGRKIPAHNLPYPKAPSKKDLEKHFKRFLDIFKRLEINIPFAEALEQMPTYAKFMKEILSKKRRYNDDETIH